MKGVLEVFKEEKEERNRKDLFNNINRFILQISFRCGGMFGGSLMGNGFSIPFDKTQNIKYVM